MIAWSTPCPDCGKGVRVRVETNGMGRTYEVLVDACIHEQRRRGVFSGPAKVIRADLLEVARAHGCAEGIAPTEKQYHKHGRFSPWRVRKVARVRRWTEAVQRYGLTSPHDARTPTREQIAAEAARVMRACGRVHVMPTRDEWLAHGRYDPITVIRAIARGKGWGAVALALGLEPAAPRYGKIRTRHTRESVVEDYRRLAASMGTAPGEQGPGRVVFEARYPYSYQVPKRMYGSWSAFVRTAGYEPQAKKGTPAPQTTRRAA